MKKKIVLFSVLAVFVLFAVIAVSSALADRPPSLADRPPSLADRPPSLADRPPSKIVVESSVWFDPEDSSAEYCETVDVDVWIQTVVPSAGFSGEFDYTFCCANVTDFVGNYTNWDLWCEANLAPPGHVKIVASTLYSNPANKPVHIGTLTIHCCDETSSCLTDLVWDTCESYIEDPDDNEIMPVAWHDGTFSCESQEKPDLVIEEKGEEWVNETHYSVSYVIHNNGTAIAPACHNTTLYVDGVAIEHKHVPVDLAYCETYTDTFDTTIECSGEFDTIRVCADNYEVIDELDETNNCLENEWICKEKKPDLTVTEITPNCGGYLFALESNEICAKIENIGEGDAGAFNVRFDIDGFSTEVRIAGLAAGENTTVCINDTTIRNAGVSLTITVTADCEGEVSESDETNNVLALAKTVVNNGYKGKRYTGGEDINTWDTFELNGNLIYSLGDSYYLSSYSYPDWTEYNAGWTTADLPIPGTATIETARLFVPYTWDKSGVMPAYAAMSFNGNPQTLDAHYSDEKGWGTSYPYGMLVYDVTADFEVSGNAATFTNSFPGGGGVSMRGMLLGVVYADSSEPERTILMNEGFDLLYGGASKCTTPEEATAYSPFGSIDTTEVQQATLITVAPGAGPDEGDLGFNTHMWYDVWNFVGTGTPEPQIGIAETDVTAYLQAADNEAYFRSSADYMEASNAFLILEKKVPCPAKYALYQANVRDPEEPLNKLRALRDNKLEDGYVTRYYEHSPALTLVLSNADPDLLTDGAQLVSKYSIPVGLHVQGMDVDERITKQDVEEALSFTERLKREVMKNGDAIGADRTEAILGFIEEFEGQVKASEGKTFSAALKSSIYYEGGQLRVDQEIVKE